MRKGDSPGGSSLFSLSPIGKRYTVLLLKEQTSTHFCESDRPPAAGACKCHWSLAFVFPPLFLFSPPLLTHDVFLVLEPRHKRIYRCHVKLHLPFFLRSRRSTNVVLSLSSSRRLSLKVATLTETWTKKGARETSMVGRRTGARTDGDHSVLPRDRDHQASRIHSPMFNN